MSDATVWNLRKSYWGEPKVLDGVELMVSPDGEHAMCKLGDTIEKWDVDLFPGETKDSESFKARKANKSNEFKVWFDSLVVKK